ncbi:MAG: rod-binding protein [Clostridia bacterium]|jgi:flagellar protein FlgJ|nr:rod-binding protein [Clostridia bacterium]
MVIDPLAGSGLTKIIEQNTQNKNSGNFQKILQQAQKEQDDKKLRAACQEIEALFIHQMLTQMRNTVPQGGLIPESTAEKIYRDMLDEQYSLLMAHSPSNLGLTDLLYDQLKVQEKIKVPDDTSTEE